MRIYIIKRRSLTWLALALFLLILALMIAGNCRDDARDLPVINPIYIGDTREKAVALMFNVDWGEDILPGILDVLQQKQVIATFFITGRFASKYPELVKAIGESEHEIGNHGYSHPHPDKISLEQNMEEISKTEKVFTQLGVSTGKIFAPPYGEHKPHVLQASSALGYKTILWTLDTIDWKEPPPAAIVDKVAGKADNGSLILMHPKKCTLEALPVLIDRLQAQQYVMKTVTNIIQ